MNERPHSSHSFIHQWTGANASGDKHSQADIDQEATATPSMFKVASYVTLHNYLLPYRVSVLLFGFFSACGVLKFNADRICTIFTCAVEVNKLAMTLLLNLGSMHLYPAVGHDSRVCCADAKARVCELLTGIHLATGGEGITAVSLGATARGDVVAHLAIGIHATSSTAGIDAFSVPAHLRVAALVVVQAAASMTIGQRISLVAWWARAHGTTADGFLATCTGSARIPRTSLG